jgi:hypothetical protein
VNKENFLLFKIAQFCIARSHEMLKEYLPIFKTFFTILDSNEHTPQVPVLTDVSFIVLREEKN